MSLPGGAGRKPASGKLLVYASATVDWRHGDTVEASGRVQTAPTFEIFDHRLALARAGITSRMPADQVRLIRRGDGSLILRVTEPLQRKAQAVLRHALPSPESALLEGIVLGDENGIPDDLRRDFNVTGATHIIASSGFNITIVATLAIAAFGSWPGVRRGSWLQP
jgi:competence protein ComEC